MGIKEVRASIDALEKDLRAFDAEKATEDEATAILAKTES